MEIINFYISLLTFIPWICLYIITIIKTLNNNKKIFSWDYFKHNLMDIFRIDHLILIVCFFFFAAFKQQFVNKYLFPVMCLYLFANSFYDKTEKLQNNFFKNNFLELIILLIVMIIPIVFYVFFRKLSLIYKVMFIIIFLEYFIVGIVKKICGIFKKSYNKV